MVSRLQERGSPEGRGPALRGWGGSLGPWDGGLSEEGLNCPPGPASDLCVSATTLTPLSRCWERALCPSETWQPRPQGPGHEQPFVREAGGAAAPHAAHTPFLSSSWSRDEAVWRDPRLQPAVASLLADPRILPVGPACRAHLGLGPCSGPWEGSVGVSRTWTSPPSPELFTTQTSAGPVPAAIGLPRAAQRPQPHRPACRGLRHRAVVLDPQVRAERGMFTVPPGSSEPFPPAAEAPEQAPRARFQAVPGFLSVCALLVCPRAGVPNPCLRQV